MEHTTLSNTDAGEDHELANEDQELAHMVALAGDEAYWNYLDEVDLHLEILEAESDCLSEEF